MKLLNPYLLLLSKKLKISRLIKIVWLNLQINIIGFMLLSVLWIFNSKSILKKEKQKLNKILREESKKWLKIKDGTRMMS